MQGFLWHHRGILATPYVSLKINPLWALAQTKKGGILSPFHAAVLAGLLGYCDQMKWNGFAA